MIVKHPAACVGTILAGLLALCLSASGPAMAVDNSDIALSDPAPEGVLQTSQIDSSRARETPAGRPDQSLWNNRHGTARRYTFREHLLPALDRPMPLFDELFEPSETRSLPHPE